jgi:nitrogen fixation protein NifQ
MQPTLSPPNPVVASPMAPAGNGWEEFEDLIALLMAHALDQHLNTYALARLIAGTCCSGSNHLWQDLKLSSRAELSQLMRDYFPALVAKNSSDMKWKKFFYRQLCEQENVLICKSPSCGVCVDYELCFGPEE